MEVQCAEIISLMDNSVDVLSTIGRSEVKIVRGWTKKPFNLPMAEHGFSMLIRVFTAARFIVYYLMRAVA